MGGEISRDYISPNSAPGTESRHVCNSKLSIVANRYTLTISGQLKLFTSKLTHTVTVLIPNMGWKQDIPIVKQHAMQLAATTQLEETLLYLLN